MVGRSGHIMKERTKARTEAESNQSTIDLAFKDGDCWLILSPQAGLNGEMLSRWRAERPRQSAEGCG